MATTFRAAATVVLCALLGCSAQNQPDDPIAELLYCYGRAADAIGEVRVHAGSADATKRARDAGAATLKGCFGDGAVFEYWFPGSAFDAQVAPDADAFPADARWVGPETWADRVSEIFRGAQYDFTQHLLANVRVERSGRNAQVVAYLIAHHIRLGLEPGAPSQCADVATGTYTLDAERVGGVWKGTRLRLTLINFDPYHEAAPGGCLRSAAPITSQDAYWSEPRPTFLGIRPKRSAI